MDGGSVRVQIWYDLAISPYPRNGSDWTHQMPLLVPPDDHDRGHGVGVG